MKDDYGYFGKGIEGYVHYMQAFNRNNKNSGKKLPSRSGCLTVMVLSVDVFLAATVIAAILI